MQENGHLKLAEVCTYTKPHPSAKGHEVFWSTAEFWLILFTN